MTELIDPKELCELARAGNSNAVEDAWLKLAESAESTADSLAPYTEVLKELVKRDKVSDAETLTATLIETVKDRFAAGDVIKVAGACLLAIGNSDDLRKQVSELYRSEFGDRDGFEGLLTEAGLPGGRPVRRALRTLDVAFALEEGSYLSGRYEEEAARVESFDTGDWIYQIKTPGGSEELGAVELADRFRPACAEEFLVKKCFDTDGLRKQLAKEPDVVVIALCKENDNKLNSDQLLDMMTPTPFTEAEFKKWWTKARAALKKCRRVRVEGRSPYSITFDPSLVSIEDETQTDFNRHRDPVDRYTIITKYVSECPGRGVEPDKTVLLACHQTLREQASEVVARDGVAGCIVAAMAWHVGELAGAESPHTETEQAIRGTPDVPNVVGSTSRSALLDRLVTALATVRPDTWTEELLSALPRLPKTYCDRAVARLTEAGVAVSAFAPAIKRILASPSDHFDALLWLWDGPACSELLCDTPLATVLTRVLRAMNEARVSDRIDKDRAKAMGHLSRSVLPARQYARFAECMESMEPGMAMALRTQLNQADNLGPSLRDTLVRKLEPLLPNLSAAKAVPAWAQEDVLYTTEAGLAAKDIEIEHHVNVKMKENAKAIGDAAEKGDLSENSEYKFALEERDLLQARLGQMNAERSQARVLTADIVSTDEIGVGTRVVFRNVDDGSSYTMTFVGPWDADLDNGLFNYRAPLAQEILGKRVGDKIVFDHSGIQGTYEVVELHNALSDGTVGTLQKA